MTSSGPPLRIGLVAKVLLAFGIVVLAALLAFSILANQAAAREGRGVMFRGGMTDNALVAGDSARGGAGAPAVLSTGTQILFDQQTVGLLVVSGPAVSTLGESLIGRVARGIWIAGAVTGQGARLARA